jgi:toxin ParE1/3/4
MIAMHKLKYLPLAVRDLNEIVDYISDALHAPKAALDLVDELDRSLLRLELFPYSCRVYQPIRPLETEYRVMPVKNYLVFYVVTEQEVEIHRILYVKMDVSNVVEQEDSR